MDKVSIIVRTCGRPEVLRGALESIRKQTYPDVETVVIEDGGVINKTGNWFNKAGNAISNAWDDTKDAVKEGAHEVKQGAQKAGDKIKETVN